MRSKLTTLDELRPYLHDGMTVMVPGFSCAGSPDTIIHAIIEWGIKDLTVITSSTGFSGNGAGALVENGLVRKYIAPFIGTNKEVVRQYTQGITGFELIPMGTLCERIRAGAFGLGGILTPTGLGTAVAEGKEIIEVDGRQYLLEKPLRADLAVIRGHIADKTGNIRYHYSARNTNPIMAMAADRVIAEAEAIVDAGMIDPDEVETPGFLVSALVRSEGGING